MYISKKLLLACAIGLFLVVGISLIGGFYTNSRTTSTNQQLTKYVQCQADWNSFLSRALEARSGAASEAQAAMDQLVSAVSQAKSDEEVRTALENYQAARTRQIQTLKDNPIPKPPDELCDDLEK